MKLIVGWNLCASDFTESSRHIFTALKGQTDQRREQKQAFSADLFGFKCRCFRALIYRCLDSCVWLSNRWCSQNQSYLWRALTDSPAGETSIDSAAEQQQTSESLDKKIPIRLAIHKPWIRLVRCAWNYNHTPLWTSSYNWESNVPRARTASHGFKRDIHCALLHSLSIPQVLSQWGLHIEDGSRYIIASDTKKKDDRFMSMGTHTLHACLCVLKCSSFSCFSPYARECELKI